MAAAGRAHRVGRRPGTGRVARGEGGKRPGRGIARRTAAHDFARHARAHRAALSGHSSHHRHARAHRHDLLGAAPGRATGSAARRRSIMTFAGVPPADLDKLQPPMSDAVKWYCRKAIEEISGRA